jgi:acyl-CoA dehydrogenase
MDRFPGFELPDELVLLREQVHRFIRDEILPLEARLDPDAADIPEEDYRRLSAKTKACGLWCLGAPEEYGGGGLGTFGMCVVLEEMAQHRMGLYNPGCGVFGRYPPPVIYGGTEEQIQRYAVPTIRDGLYTFFAITEPSGGSDPARAIRTRAVRDGDAWVLNGSKIFISHAHEAEWGVVFARSNPRLAVAASAASSSRRERRASLRGRSERSGHRLSHARWRSRIAACRSTTSSARKGAASSSA